MKPAPTLLAAALALGLAACANDNNADSTAAAATDAASASAATTAAGTPAADAMAPDTGNAAAAGGAALAESDRKALAAVMEVDRHEIAAAGDALSKDVQGEVRNYAQMLRDDHTRNLEATQRLMGDASSAGMAGGTGPASGNSAADAGSATGTGTATGSRAADATGVQVPSDPELAAMRDKHDAERERLLALEGEAFASAWVDAMVKGHEEALAKLDDELIPGASDAGVRQHLQDTRAAISRHLDTGRSLQSGSGSDAE